MGHGDEQCKALARFGFHDRVAGACAIVQTGELRAWPDFMFQKGVIAKTELTQIRCTACGTQAGQDLAFFVLEVAADVVDQLGHGARHRAARLRRRHRGSRQAPDI